MEPAHKTALKRALWIIVPVLAVGALALPRALAWGHRHHHVESAEELAEHMEHGIDHLFDKVDASDEQREQANAIAERHAQELFALATQGHALRQQAKQVLLAAELDRTKLTALQAQIDELTKQASQIGLNTVFELSEVLTPAQRQQVAERLARFER